MINDLISPDLYQALQDKEENHRKIQRRVETYKINIRNEPRKGKHLLVLDIDYTLFDHRSVAEAPMQLARPYLHEFLTRAYKHYDIIIWSATSMKWVELKMYIFYLFRKHLIFEIHYNF